MEYRGYEIVGTATGVETDQAGAIQLQRFLIEKDGQSATSRPFATVELAKRWIDQQLTRQSD